MIVSLAQFKKAFAYFANITFTPKVPASEYVPYFAKLAFVNYLLTKNWASLADENGMLSVDPFYESYLQIFEHTEKAEFKGFTFDKNDLNEFINILKVEVGAK